MESDLTTELVKLLFAIVAPILSALIMAVLIQAFRKLGLQIGAEQQAKLEGVVQQAILSTEEWAAARIKAGINTTTAKDKLARALSMIVDRVPGITAEEATALIEAELVKVGHGATAFVEDMRDAATAGARS